MKNIPQEQSIQTTTKLIDWLFTFPSTQSFAIRLWNGNSLAPTDTPPTFTLVLSHPGALRRMFSPPLELSIGEAFIYGDFDIEGDIHAAIAWIDTFSQLTFSLKDLAFAFRMIHQLPDVQGSHYQGRGRARLSGGRHSRARDRAAITYHYDVGNDFYALWMDKRMTYSCAYFKHVDDSLDTAQQQKYAHICRKLQLIEGEKLLDIGCGWGGLVMYAARHYGVHAVGVTLSEKQFYLATQRIADAGLEGRADVRLQDYRELANEDFDKIVSVGMFEHVGLSHLPEYFGQVYRLLKPGGLFLNHGISKKPQANGQNSFFVKYILGTGTFIQRYVFPDGELVPVSQVNLIAECAGFEVRDVENLREHYALTLRHWVKNLEAHQIEAVLAADQVIFRIWRLYMAASVRGFETGNINVNQTLFLKSARSNMTLPLTREYIYLT